MLSALLVLQLLIAVSFGGVIDNDLSPIRGGRIAGGTEATRNQFPYQVAVFVYSRDGQSICGGSILSANWILSAAHCFLSFESADVLAGIHNIIQDDPSYELEIFPNDVVNHPLYNGVNHLNDISCVRTSRRPIIFNAAVQPITLIPRSMANTDLTNTIGSVAGWGRVNDVSTEISPRLLFINAPIVSNADCTRIYGNVVTSSNVCLSGASGKSTCRGDSGGPLTIVNANRPVQVGIVSFGSENGCQRGFPTVFARVSSFHNWIQSTTGITIA